MTTELKPYQCLQTVLKMARALYKDHGEFCHPAKCPGDVESSFERVEKMIAELNATGRRKLDNEFDNAVDALFDAMEEHGNKEGTETQLGDTGQALRTALKLLPIDKRQVFLDETKSLIPK